MPTAPTAMAKRRGLLNWLAHSRDRAHQSTALGRKTLERLSDPGAPRRLFYGDTLGAGRLWALDLQVYFASEVGEFIARGKPVIGICNGFQALVKAGLLPGAESPVPSGERPATLTFNSSGRFECRWVTLVPRSTNCLWTRGLTEPIECPVAHGEGNFVVRAEAQSSALQANDQIALVYARDDGESAAGEYPFIRMGHSRTLPESAIGREMCWA